MTIKMPLKNCLKKLAGHPVVEYEDAAVFAVADGLYDAVKAYIQLLYGEVDDE